MIRKGKINDLTDIQNLICSVNHVNFSLDYLSWLLQDPFDSNQLNSLVLLDNGRLIGHVGYIKSHYQAEGNVLSGSHPFLLAILSEYRGLGLGKELLLQAASIGDISLIFEGTQDAIKVYPGVGYKKILNLRLYRKWLNWPIPEQIKSQSLKMYGYNLITLLINMSFFKVPANKKTDRLPLVFSDYSLENTEFFTGLDARISNIPKKETIEWFLQCPTLKALSLRVGEDKFDLGILMMYINDHGKYKTGRILHLPNCGGNEQKWRLVLKEAEFYFHKEGCNQVSVCSSHPIYTKVLFGMGYLPMSTRAIWLRDPDNLTLDKEWHVTYLEGDNGFRGV